jgi:cytochrome c biogenesis protein CcdA/thiol-disulfide isomerase/thioredoxin
MIFSMFSLVFALYAAGLLTILLPCILPILPVVLGVGIAERNKWRPLIIIAGMIVSFVGFTFLLQVALRQFVEAADFTRIGTYYVLLLFGLGFLTHSKPVQLIGALLGGLFFLDKGWTAVVIAMIIGVIAMEVGGRVAGKIQQLGADVQGKARTGLGANSFLATFIIGLTLGLVWVPCAGPALGFALALVRNQPGWHALLLLTIYALGAGTPLLLVGYGGQRAVRSAHQLSRYSGRIKQISGVLLIISAIAFRYQWFTTAQTWLVQNTSYGAFGTSIEQRLLGRNTPVSVGGSALVGLKTASGSSGIPTPSPLPKIGQAPEFVDLGPWHNSQPLTLKSLRGKVVLIDFWTYTCINCIRTLPYEEATWKKFKGKPFILLGVHTPEFTFEANEANVSDAIKRHGLTYPTAQDNNYGTWNAFNNQYWPAKYLIDAEGNIRYTHFGEGAYEETDQAIASLLGEIGVDTSTMPTVTSGTTEGQQGYRPVTPEIYLKSRSWDAFGNKQGAPSDKTLTYKAPDTLALHKYYLDGTWKLTGNEGEVLQSNEGEIRIRARAGEVNLVLGLEDGIPPVQADIWVDGKKTQSVTIDRHDLFNLYRGAYGEHDVVLKIHGKGVAGYAFTFGS